MELEGEEVDVAGKRKDWNKFLSFKEEWNSKA